MLRSFASPYPMVQFLPTGGIGLQNMMEYLSLPNVRACGGSWLCPQKLLKEKRFDEVERLTREAVTKLHGFSLSKIRLSCGTTMEGWDKLAVLNGFSASGLLEMSGIRMLEGEKGSIEITVNDVHRAKPFLERRGFSFRAEESRTEIAGFTLYLQHK